MPVPVVRGNVKATQPTLRPDQIVAAPPPPPSEPPAKSMQRIVAPATAPTAAPPEPPLRISAEDARGKWGQFVEQARVQRIAVGTMLSESHLVDVRENSLRIGCPDDFHANTLQRHRQFIADLAQEIYGAKLKLETILAEAPPHAPRHEAPLPSAATAPIRAEQHPVSGPDDLHAHPVVQALIRDFGAQEIL